METTSATSWRWRILSRMATAALAMSALPWLPTASAETGTKAADFFVSSMPGQPPGPLLKMHAGHIAVSEEHHGNLFFWHFANRHIANRRRTVIWLNGGPGCSSMDGALMEIGPYRVKKDGNLEYNEGSWDEFANVLFVDNPVGTGFSYVDGDSLLHELPEMAAQFVKFLEKWFKIFPEYLADDIYISGESYAGQHIPHIAKAMLDRNKKAGKDQQWNIAGLLIGNGWISPVDQYFSYLKYAYKEGLVQGGTDIAKRIESQVGLCQSALEGSGKGKVDVGTCEKILTDILDLTKDTSAPKNKVCTNMYDIRLKSDASCGLDWPPDLVQVTPYLRRREVVQALHIDPDKKTGWQECSGSVSSNFRAENSQPSIQLLPDLLTEVPIVLFSGDRDLICNHLGTEELIGNMEWGGGKGFELSPGVTAPRRNWEFEGEPAGFYQETRNLTYILFYNSSHMVPFDYPRRTRDMLDRFMGVDIASVGGTPVDSMLDGEKAGPETSVGGHPNSTAAQEAERLKLQEASWRAYQRSGEVALVIVALAACVWGWWIWRERSKRAGYTGLFSSAANGGGPGGVVRAAFSTNSRGANSRDLEAADFDEHELDEHPNGHANGTARRDRYADTDEESDEGRTNGEKGKKLYDQPVDRLEREHYEIGDESDSEAEDSKGAEKSRR